MTVSRHAGGASTSRASLRVRPLEADDLPAAGFAAAAAFGHDLASREAHDRWLARVGHALRTDPAGCFVAERDGQVIGVAEAIVREQLWVLSLLATDPRRQSGGVGRLLMDRVLTYGRDAAAVLIVSSNDPRALRLYAAAGFALLPTLHAEGELDRRRIPAICRGVREGDAGDIEWLASLTREVRGAPHTPELHYALRMGARLLLIPDRGFAIVQPGQHVWLLVARDEEAATALLWSGLEASAVDGHPTRVRWLTAGQQWAITVALTAGLSIQAYGALCVRGRTARLAPFIPSAAFA